MKAQALAENPVDEEYEPLKTYFPDEEVMYVDVVGHEEKPGWKLFFDRAANIKGVGTGAVLILEIRSVEFRQIPRIHNEIVDALATLASILHHPDKTYVDPLHIQVRDQHAYCNVVEEEIDGEPWFHDVKEYIKGILYKRTPDLGLLRCIDAKQASTIIAKVHAGVCGPHMSGYVLPKKILRAGYYWLTMERDYISFVRKCHQCQVHDDLVYSPPSELHTMFSPWTFVAWGMDVIGPIEPATSNGRIGLFWWSLITLPSGSKL
ncbi:uncharacterized protein [Nicotiana tomentosiformis]|uniref:uncharacterized protein n=1 Tax=Nicotiana tomentosiformis TaxID=4098 RepID=UPI00388C65AE